jgi:positive regulator of sigma E activity
MCYELTIHVEPQHRSACVSSGAREQCGQEMTHTFQSLEFLEAEAPN